MNGLLAKILDAHGGLALRDRYTRIEASVTVDGTLWALKGIRRDPGSWRIRVWLHEQRVWIAPVGGAGWSMEFTPGRVAILDRSGAVRSRLLNPRVAFVGHEVDTRWEPLHWAYFAGCALWTCVATPFLLAGHGVSILEIEPRIEQSETWRVLRSRFPAGFATHSTVQDFFFGRDLLLRRHDYSIDIAGGLAVSELVFDYAEAAGISFPTRCIVCARGPSDPPLAERPIVSVAIGDLCFVGPDDADPSRPGPERSVGAPDAR
ncbi:hypothetical protein [Azospirillum sp. TSO35-2]|uniref:hypothetical protein n=1 Tax=Azospirillum sp. TSO35-2 TaxID=716796 RepID=UPI000D651341|nr:hypothetical protein [Azospirillum sp. TSO35-2]